MKSCAWTTAARRRLGPYPPLGEQDRRCAASVEPQFRPACRHHAGSPSARANARWSWIATAGSPRGDPVLLATSLAGHDIVLARRRRKQHSPFRRWRQRCISALLAPSAGAASMANSALSASSPPGHPKLLRFRDRDGTTFSSCTGWASMRLRSTTSMPRGKRSEFLSCARCCATRWRDGIQTPTLRVGSLPRVPGLRRRGVLAATCFTVFRADTAPADQPRGADPDPRRLHHHRHRSPPVHRQDLRTGKERPLYVIDKRINAKGGL